MGGDWAARETMWGRYKGVQVSTRDDGVHGVPTARFPLLNQCGAEGHAATQEEAHGPGEGERGQGLVWVGGRKVCAGEGPSEPLFQSPFSLFLEGSNVRQPDRAWAGLGTGVRGYPRVHHLKTVPMTRCAR